MPGPRRKSASAENPQKVVWGKAFRSIRRTEGQSGWANPFGGFPRPDAHSNLRVYEFSFPISGGISLP
jgi:hypothetical protein